MFLYLKHNKYYARFITALVLGAILLSPSLSFVHAEESGDLPAEPQVEETVVLEEAEDPAIETYEGDEETVIETGDAVAESEVTNEVNTNSTDLEITDESASTTEESAEQTEELLTDTGSSTEESTLISASPDATAFDVENTNNATTTTIATTTADTGDNNASGNDVTINTGDAVAVANITNVINTNITDSDGVVAFINNTLGYSNFDVRDTFEDVFTNNTTANSTPSCNLSSCQDGSIDLTVQNNNNTVINNDVTVIANTGGNSATGANANINTGNAYAAANIVNVANTNITDSNYLLLVFNNFEDYAGDIVLPSSTFFDNLVTHRGSTGDVSVANNNSASIQNNIEVTADTGGNSATGANANINTGNAMGVSTALNQVNTNIVGGNSFTMLIRVHGDWNGRIFGLPEGMSWVETPYGIQLYYTGNTNGGNGVHDDISVTNNNNAVINNNVQVYALTGDNKVVADDNGEVETGDAYADSNIVNLANTNIVGSNWSSMIFNIFGNWNGNLAFGQPDLWVGARAESEKEQLMPGDDVTYTFTIFNSGDTAAHNVLLRNSFERDTLRFNTPDNQFALGGLTYDNWNLGTIEAGETVELVYKAKITEDMSSKGISALPLQATVESQENDANDEDNTDTITIYVGRKDKGENERRTFAAKFDIEKTADKDLIAPGDTVSYNVSFYNRGGQLYDAILIDILRDENGNVIQEQSWPLDTIPNGEEINISYDVTFSTGMATGTYTNTAQVFGYHTSRVRKYQTIYESALTQHMLTISDGPTPLVLGVSTDTCEEYLTSYMGFGRNNDINEVTRLQQFLNQYEGEDIEETGMFDLTTEIAVRNFQNKYNDDILAPWGLSNNSGYVYYTTKQKINEIYCQNTQSFPMTLAQQNEIEAFKQKFAFASDPETPPLEEVAKAESLPPALPKETELSEIQPETGNRETPTAHSENNSIIDKIMGIFGGWFKKVAEAAN